MIMIHSCEYKIERIEGVRIPIIWMTGRNEKGERKFIEETRFRPYFYCKHHDAIFLKDHHPDRVTRIDTGYQDLLYRQNLVRVYTPLPGDVKDLREFLKENGGYSWEADILFPLRFMIDTGIKCGMERRDGKYTLYDDVQPNLRICTLDIETLTPRSDRKIDPDGQYPITCITLHDSWTNDSIMVYWYDQPIDLNPRIASMVDTIRHCYTERSLLMKVQDWIRTYDPDIIAGFNVQFDLIQIIKRMRYYDISVNALSPIGQTTERANEILIKGREAFDVYKAYRILHKGELRKYSLEFILEAEECSVRKIPIWDFKKAWEDEPETVIERNMIDVLGLVELLEKLELIEFFDEIRRQVGCRFSEAMIRSSVVDNLILRDAYEYSVVLPTKIVPDQEFETVGGKIDKPIPGIYDNVAYLDLTAMYPSAIIQKNISPETVIRNPDPREDCHHVTSGVGFWKEPEGIIPRVITKLSTIRAAKKKLLKEYTYEDKEYDKLFREQEVLKYQINAVYGYTKYKFARLKSDYVMEAVASEARRVLDLITDEIKKTNDVIYRDTDSGYCQLTTDNYKDEADKIVDRLNVLSDYEIKVEYLIDRILLLARKNYALLTYDGEVIIKGRKRSDVSLKSAEIQETLFDMVLTRREEEIIPYLRKEIQDIQHERIEPFLLAIPKKWAKPLHQYAKDRFPIHVRAAIYSNKYLDTDFLAGDKVHYLHIGSFGSYPHTVESRKKMRKVTAIGIQEQTIIPEGITIDWEGVIDGDIKGKCEPILKIIGKEWTDLTHRTLDGWFK